MLCNVTRKNILSRLNKLNELGSFKKYPDYLLGNTCIVKVNADDYLKQDEFIIATDYPVLPRQIYIFGKQTERQGIDEDNLYINYWLEAFLKTIQKGNLCKAKFKKSNSRIELTIGLPINFRIDAFHGFTWERKEIIKFLSCLFGVELEESFYYQQGIMEMIA